MKTEKNTQVDMEKSHRVVDDEFCFHCHYPNITGTQNAYAYYEDHKKKQNELYKSNTPIAIDTNVLLDLYSISFKERTQFLKFINENAHRIIITSQVQKEYMDHRVDAIQSFIRTLREVEGFPKKVQDSLKQSFDSALSQLKSNGNRPIVSNDMKGVPDYIKVIREFIEQNKFGEEFLTKLDEKFAPLIESVKKGVEQSLSKAIYELNDPVLAALSKATILTDLPAEERSFLEEKFNSLLDDFNQHKQDSTQKELYSFPGCGDRKKIKEGRDPYGDFIIYHELLSYMWHQNKDVVYLTNDVTKTDWIRQDGKPFNHYIVDTFINTGHMLYIFNARDFTTLSFEAVAEVDPAESDDAIEENSAKEYNDQITTPPIETTQVEQGQEAGQVSTVIGEENVETHNLTASEAFDESQRLSLMLSSLSNYSYLRDISRERFLQELETAELWANSYGDGYVNKDYFVYTILGHKRFHFNSSFKMLEELVCEGVVNIVEEEHDGRTIKCLQKVK